MFPSTAINKQIYIKRKSACCRRPQYGSEFPQELTGIITPQEFYQSIVNINQAYRLTFWEAFFLLIGYFCLSVGFVLFTTLRTQSIQDNALMLVIIVASVLIVLGFIIYIGLQFRIKYSRRTRVRDVLAGESMKYSTRLMLPFRWRFESDNIPGTAGVRYSTYKENIVIEIGQRSYPLNSYSVQPTSHIGQQYPIYYSSHPAAISYSNIRL